MLFWVGHACFYAKANGLNIFIDPFRVPPQLNEKADLILITHSHFDHCNKEDIDRIAKKDTVMISSQGGLQEMGYRDVITSKPGFKYDFKGIKIEAVPAYNVVEERLNYHPKSNNWVGYVLDVNSTRIYHAGDTDFIKEMAGLNNLDAALLPIGGTYVMTVEEAIDAGKAINAKSTVPMHYKNLLGVQGSAAAEEKFKRGLGSALIMKEVVEPTYSF